MTTSGEAITVLHVDDEPDFADMVAQFLEAEADWLSVRTATSASDGLEQLDAFDAIDCIVSDYEMPAQTGIEFLEDVRETHPDLPFILYTGKGSESVASDAIAAGVTDYLQKEQGTGQYTVLANRIKNAVTQYRTQHAIEETEHRYRRLIEAATDVITVVDENGVYDYVSPAAERLLGYAAEELLGENGFEYIHPEDRADAMAQFMDVVENPEHQITAEFRFNHPDGEWTWLQVTGRNLLADPTINGMVVYARDITERKEREAYLERLMGNLPGVVYRCRNSPGWPMESVRGSCLELTGYEAEQIESGAVSWGDDIIHPGDQGSVWASVQEALREGESFELEYRIVAKDGTEKWVWEQGTGTYDQDGDLQVIEGFITDITDREARKRELERYEQLVETTGDAMYTLDEAGHFTYVNDSLIAMSGYNEETLLGEHVSIVLEEEDIANGNQLIRSLLSSDERRGTYEMELHTASGTSILTENHIALLHHDGAFAGTVGVLRDITDRAKRERQLESERNRLDEFASLVSHDLRSPLNVAQGHLELAQEASESEHLETVARAHDRMDRLIDDLLTLAREGGDVSDEEAIELSELLERCWANIPTGAATLEHEVAQTISADRSRLQQLLENLFKNAYEHGGETVTVGEVPGGFYVVDDGPGIPPAERSRVFDAGYSSSADGTGFGLSIVERIVDAHGWEVRITEGDAGGAQFEITGVQRLPEEAR